METSRSRAASILPPARAQVQRQHGSAARRVPLCQSSVSVCFTAIRQQSMRGRLVQRCNTGEGGQQGNASRGTSSRVVKQGRNSAAGWGSQSLELHSAARLAGWSGNDGKAVSPAMSAQQAQLPHVLVQCCREGLKPAERVAGGRSVGVPGRQRKAHPPHPTTTATNISEKGALLTPPDSKPGLPPGMHNGLYQHRLSPPLPSHHLLPYFCAQKQYPGRLALFRRGVPCPHHHLPPSACAHRNGSPGLYSGFLATSSTNSAA